MILVNDVKYIYLRSFVKYIHVRTFDDVKYITQHFNFLQPFHIASINHS